MTQKKVVAKKKGGASGKKKTGGKKSKFSKPKKGKHSNKRNKSNSSRKKKKEKSEKKNKKDKSADKKKKKEGIEKDEGGSAEGGGGKREAVENIVDEVRGNSGDNSRDQQPVNPVELPKNTASKDTNTQTRSQDQLPGTPLAAPVLGMRAIKPKRPKDPVKVAAKLQIQTLAASRSIECSKLVQPETFVMNRYGAIFFAPLPLAMASLSDTSGDQHVNHDSDDTVSTSGDEG